MTKKIIYILFILIFTTLPSYAEKIPVKITPIQVISTKHDEIEVGDWIKFVTVNDVYLDDNLYITKNTDVIGIVDHVHPNGWTGDSAQIYFKNFYATDVNKKKVTISYPLDISGKVEMATKFREMAAYFLLFIIRGSEICIEPDTQVFNIFIER